MASDIQIKPHITLVPYLREKAPSWSRIWVVWNITEKRSFVTISGNTNNKNTHIHYLVYEYFEYYAQFSNGRGT